MRKITFSEEQLKYILKESIDELTAYHGSGADFNKFDHKHYLDTGCGSQSFGWGSYVTDDVAIGQSYADGTGGDIEFEFDGNDIKDEDVFEDSFRSNTPLKDNQELYNLYRMFSSYGFSVDNVIKQYMSNIENGKKNLSMISDESRQTQMQNWIKYAENMVKLLKDLQSSGRLVSKKKDRYLYEVEIPEDNGTNYIGWYEEFPHEFMERVLGGLHRLNHKYLDAMAQKDYTFRSTLYDYLKHPNFDGIKKALANESGYSTFMGGGMNAQSANSGEGRTVYRRLQSLFNRSDKAASLFLLHCGFTGIKYETGTKWKKPDGAAEDGHNYVIFDANDIKITNKTNIGFRRDNIEL